jgi:hypothetical protein
MKGKTLSWNDRLTLIHHYKPTDVHATEAFGISQSELDVARTQLKAGVFSLSPELDVDSYGHLFASTEPSTDVDSTVTSTKSPGRRAGSTSTTKGSAPETATKIVREAKKRGRKGDKILKAFSSIPASPVAAEEFAKTHGVSIAVLRQSKRFDTTRSTGTVRVKKDKGTKTLMIWREEA